MGRRDSISKSFRTRIQGDIGTPRFRVDRCNYRLTRNTVLGMAGQDLLQIFPVETDSAADCIIGAIFVKPPRFAKVRAPQKTTANPLFKTANNLPFAC